MDHVFTLDSFGIRRNSKTCSGCWRRNMLVTVCHLDKLPDQTISSKITVAVFDGAWVFRRWMCVDVMIYLDYQDNEINYEQMYNIKAIHKLFSYINSVQENLKMIIRDIILLVHHQILFRSFKMWTLFDCSPSKLFYPRQENYIYGGITALSKDLFIIFVSY